jgi:hypothetical protein
MIYVSQNKLSKDCTFSNDMNIFFLSWDPDTCAQLYCDQHVNKILLEIVQMLYTAWYFLGKDEPGTFWERMGGTLRLLGESLVIEATVLCQTLNTPWSCGSVRTERITCGRQSWGWL